MQVDGEDPDTLEQCEDASSYCGIYHKKYPDARPMGFPFDRPATDNVVYLNDFISDNMIAQDVIVKFLNKTVTSVDQGTGGAGHPTDAAE